MLGTLMNVYLYLICGAELNISLGSFELSDRLYQRDQASLFLGEEEVFKGPYWPLYYLMR